MSLPRPFPRTEQLAYWFFRLNGCLNLVNFLVHHERQGREGTDVDVLAVRFPYRQELMLSGEPMGDHQVFDSNGKIDLVIAEVKTGKCDLNGPWTDPNKQNMHRVLHIIGAFPDKSVDTVAKSLYIDHYFESDFFRCRLFSLGGYKNSELPYSVVQLTWEEVLFFIHQRFVSYERYKTQHQQWDTSGRLLFKAVQKYRREPTEFIESILNRLKD